MNDLWQGIDGVIILPTIGCHRLTFSLQPSLDTPGSLEAVGRGWSGEDLNSADRAQRSDSHQEVNGVRSFPRVFCAEIDCLF